MASVARQVSLVALDAAEHASFLDAQAVEYAEQKARAGVWTRESSLERAREEIRSLLASSSGPPPHRFYRGLDDAGRLVGWVWTGPVPGAAADPAVVWLYQITVAPTLRGRGYGRALLAATEDEVRARGGRELRLNVFAWNGVALSLYRSSGYETVSEDGVGFELRKAFT